LDSFYLPEKVMSMSSKFGCNGPRLGCIKSAIPAPRAVQKKFQSYLKNALVWFTSLSNYQSL